MPTASEALRRHVEAKGEVLKWQQRSRRPYRHPLHLVARIDGGDEQVESTLTQARLHFKDEHGNPEEYGE